VKVSLIIPAYNEEAQIGACLDSIIKHAGGKLHEIIVVDNASTDRTADIARTWPGVRVTSEPERGPTRARDAGNKVATGDLIAYVDADTRVPPGWVDKIFAEFAANPSMVSLSGPAHYFDASPLERMLLSLSWWIAAPLMYRLTGYMIYGANVVIRKDILDKVGGFNRTIDFYGDETELARRLRHHGAVVFKMSFFMNCSARRFRKEGILWTSIVYSMNYVWPVLFGKPYTLKHTDVRQSS
jgi:glycosyltransferase involved in cell wall biosynthesis